MLHRLHIRNFTVFEDAVFEFSPGLNVVVGTNGTGKSHVLKLGYAVEVAAAGVERAQEHLVSVRTSFTDLATWVAALYKLSAVFQVKQNGKLIRRQEPLEPTTVEARLGVEQGETLQFELTPPNDAEKLPASMSIDEYYVPHSATSHREGPVFIPAKELLTMMPDIIGLNEQYLDLLDSTYTDLARKLTIRSLTKLPDYAVPVIAALGEAMHGRIQADNGRFYLQPTEGEPFEIGLVAEGLRKLGTLAYLLSNGTLTPRTTLYWDEPEANLNPALLRQLAALLVELAAGGFQIILATHSLFLLKEFHILAQQTPAAQVRYFGLSAEPGAPTTVATADNLELLSDIVALDAELEQADRFQDVLDRPDADR